MKKRDKKIIAVALVGIVVLIGIFVTIYPGMISNGGSPGCPIETAPPGAFTLYQPTSPDNDGIINLDWSDSARFCHYNVYRHIVGVGDELLANSKYFGDVSSYTVTETSNGNYYYKIEAYNRYGSSGNIGRTWSGDYVTVKVELTESAPNAPFSNAIQPYYNLNGIVEFNWFESAGATSYNVYRSVDGGTTYYPLRSGITGTRLIGITDSGLSSGTYIYKVTGVNDVGESIPSTPQGVVVTVPELVPNAPYLNTIYSNPSLDFGEIGMNWIPKGAEANYYTIQRSKDGGSFSEIKYGIIDTGYIDTVTENGVYTYEVKAINEYGSSGWSNPQSFTMIFPLPPNEKPVATIDSIDPIYATQGTDTISFSGSGTDSDGTISEYQWLLADETVLSNSKSFEKPASEFSVGDVIIYFRVKDDRGDWSDKVSRLITIEEEEVILKPAAPYLGRINSPDDDGIIQLTWSVVFEADTYNVYRNGVSIKAGLITNGYSDEGLLDGTYKYKITAVNIGGESDYSNEVVVVVEISDGNGNEDIPNKPTQYHLPSHDYDGSINLQWFVVSNADSYNIYRSSDGINFNKVASGITGNTHTDSCGDIGTYYYKITAVNTYGESDFSDVESIEVVEVEQEDLTGVIVMLVVVIIGGIALILIIRRLKKKT